MTVGVKIVLMYRTVPLIIIIVKYLGTLLTHSKKNFPGKNKLFVVFGVILSILKWLALQTVML